MASCRFRPALWATCVVLALSAVMISLGGWQIGRGQAKADLQRRYEQAPGHLPLMLSAQTQAQSGEIVWAQVQGHFDATQQLLLDNQSHQRQPGYHVWTPLRLKDAGVVMVDRGWIAANLDRTRLPQLAAPSTEQVIQGYWKLPPAPGLRVQSDLCETQGWPRIAQYPTVADLRCVYGDQLAGGILLMAPEAEGGYLRDWQIGAELSPLKHYGYAGQWFAFTAVLWFFYIRLSLKKAS